MNRNSNLILLCLLVCIYSIRSNAQVNIIDSIKATLIVMPNDTVKVMHLNDLATYLQYSNPALSMYCAARRIILPKTFTMALQVCCPELNILLEL